jgi:hypothetical protein
MGNMLTERYSVTGEGALYDGYSRIICSGTR